MQNWNLCADICMSESKCFNRCDVRIKQNRWFNPSSRQVTRCKHIDKPHLLHISWAPSHIDFHIQGAQYMQIGMSRDAIIEAAKRYVKLERATKAKLQLNNYWIFQIVARSQFPPEPPCKCGEWYFLKRKCCSSHEERGISLYLLPRDLDLRKNYIKYLAVKEIYSPFKDIFPWLKERYSVHITQFKGWYYEPNHIYKYKSKYIKDS